VGLVARYSGNKLESRIVFRVVVVQAARMHLKLHVREAVFRTVDVEAAVWPAVGDVIEVNEILECNNVGQSTFVVPNVQVVSSHLALIMKFHGSPVALKTDRRGGSVDVCEQFAVAEHINGRLTIEEDHFVQHFGQAYGSFPTTTFFTSQVDWAASTHEAELTLHGSFDDPACSHIEQLLLKHMEKTTDLDFVTDVITEEEWIGKMRVWHESTQTSPSGMHLGHHKSLVREFLPDHDTVAVKVPSAPSVPAI
jgi:hypothetical protein